MSKRMPAAYLKAGDRFAYRLQGSAAPQTGTVKTTARGANGGTVIVLIDGTRLTFDAGQHIIRAAATS